MSGFALVSPLLAIALASSWAANGPPQAAEDERTPEGAPRPQEPAQVRERLSQFDPQWFDMGEGAPTAMEQARNVYKQIHLGEGSIDAHLRNAQDAICANQRCKADARQGPLLLDFALPGRNALARAYNHLRQVLADTGAGLLALREAHEALEAAADKNRQNAASIVQAAQALAAFPNGIKIRPPSSEGDNGATQEALGRIQAPDNELRRTLQQMQRVREVTLRAQAGFSALEQEANEIEAKARKAGESHSNSLASLGDNSEGGPSYLILRSALDQLREVRMRITKVLAASQATILELGRAGGQLEQTADQIDQARAYLSELLDRAEKIHAVYPEIREAWDRGARDQAEAEAQTGKTATAQVATRAKQPAGAVAQAAAVGGCPECVGAIENISAAFGDPRAASGFPLLGPISLSITSSGSAEGASAHNVSFGQINRAVKSNPMTSH